MLRTIALAAVIAAPASVTFAQQAIDCSQAANAERSECLALPTMSTQNANVNFNNLFTDPAFLTTMGIGFGLTVFGNDKGGATNNTQ